MPFTFLFCYLVFQWCELFRDSCEPVSNMPHAEHPAMAMNQGLVFVDFLIKERNNNCSLILMIYSKANLSLLSDTLRCGRLSKESLSSTILPIHVLHKQYADDVLGRLGWECYLTILTVQICSCMVLNYLDRFTSTWEVSGSTPMKGLWKQCSLGCASQPKELLMLKSQSYLKGGPDALQSKDNTYKSEHGFSCVQSL